MRFMMSLAFLLFATSSAFAAPTPLRPDEADVALVDRSLSGGVKLVGAGLLGVAAGAVDLGVSAVEDVGHVIGKIL
ncbi:hypothetical protein DACRYDRAFT_25668 [Dacryopinax primogenitus]|uniref:Uncharacterized protein n=1 Tax=Dacryopinax primogenitus (strain DJM 731) TaxID=1858805 RepID=M5FMY8_DACPD|nr:uncharacterized protein DACRYDRAFT_25668 [Dacryopinax primogenitus]EJT96520.1 hypothetical protein DACRYDRAFT_25668 [Dacryopinax primogenitus]